MNRSELMESVGAVIPNIQWGWSGVNHDEKFVLFGAFTERIVDGKAMILSDDWIINPETGNRTKGYKPSREHLRLVQEEGYRLKYFKMENTNIGERPAKIGRIYPEIYDAVLQKIGRGWFAVDYVVGGYIPEEVDPTKSYKEGTVKSVTVNAYERNREARQACLDHYGYDCQACDFNFESVYGDIGKEFIHVHHVVPLAETQGVEYELDPINDLIPVCPNCHAIIHKAKLQVPEMKELLQ